MSEKPIIFTGESPTKILSEVKTQTRRICKQGFDVGGHTARAICPALEDGWIAWFGRLSTANIEEFTKKAYTNGFACPYGKPGDRLWVREGLKVVDSDEDVKTGLGQFLMYAADDQPRGWTHDEPGSTLYPFGKSVVSPMFMPRWASRITLEIAEVRVQRVQDISEEDARAEGIRTLRDGSCTFVGREGPRNLVTPWLTAKEAFADLWDSLHAKPKPVLESGKTVSYISHPWAGTPETKTHRGKPWLILPNPFVWAISFKRVTS